jgi:hypothetical protein
VHALGEDCYVVDDVQGLPPFLTTLVGDGDLWLFATSNGGITAGRRSPATALFPYVTEDKLADAPGVSGPATALVAERDGRAFLWEPLSAPTPLLYRIHRRLYRNALGTLLAFEEENEDLGLRFQSAWRASAAHGLVRDCTIANLGREPVRLRLLDGLLDLLPGEADEQLQLTASVLLDAYKQAERLPGTTLAAFTLAAKPIDRPEPREALRATVVWSEGLPDARVHLSGEARRAFLRGRAARELPRTRGERGAYLVEATLDLQAGATRGWTLVADVARTQADVALLRRKLCDDPAALVADVRADLARGAARVEALVAAADGVQRTADGMACAHHLSNVLFNGMRGGVYAHGDAVPGEDFAAFVRAASRPVAARHAALLASLPRLERREAHAARLAATGDADLVRLSSEYLPLCFGRRHGDPSRPWNRFEIRVRDERGDPVLDYQGNWRDIFQNWESLSRSFPGFAEQIVAKFVNASTADGHNPYRIGRSGIDWEVPEPHHPWSTIGYWGDHQVVYLLRLLELSLAHHPDRIPALLEAARFTYADVPYRFRPWAEMAADPRRTIVFDEARHRRILERVRAIGSDGRLLHGAEGPVRVTLAEKLLVTALGRVAALVPGGGIWMNTQRPEWNDANNALAGPGVSVVTACHLERYLALLAGLLSPLAGRETPLSPEVATWMERTLAVLRAHRPLLDAPTVEDGARGRVMEALGTAAADYRASVYERGPSPARPAPGAALLELVRLAGDWVRHVIAAARRPDGLFHAYQVLVPRGAGRGFGLHPLEEMLEGQVAALATRAVDDEAACALLDALARSRLYRADQRSYLLYPDRTLPGFLDKNVLPEEALADAPVLSRLLAEARGRVLVRDVDGHVRFQADLANADAVRAALHALRAEGFPGLGDAEESSVLEAYERVFHHRAFTGRSGSMFAYEGLGSVYWHMVGKLLLAVQERHAEAAARGAPAAVLGRLAAHANAIREGMGGLRKSPAEWGAFPIDAYSHSPERGGARQPGMTGQVKEEILVRLGELGVTVDRGRLAFRPLLLRAAEFLSEPAELSPLGVHGDRQAIALHPGTLAFTVCQVPVVYHLGEEARLRVTDAGGATREFPGDELDEATSADVFERRGRVRRIDVWIRSALTGR